ncbi:MAG TPA: response regulator [Sedimentibacter sp.]|nr:response regulator [Sedimentibacter sp.]
MSEDLLNILIIEDNKDLADIMYELLALSGHRVSVADNGTEGIAKARELRPDAIICDIGLPDMSGYEFAKIIRQDTELKNTYLIASSGYAQQEDVERSRVTGFNRNLAKPVSFDTLETILKCVIKNAYSAG